MSASGESPTFARVFSGANDAPRWSFQVYNCFTLLLSCIILCCVCVMHEMSRTASVLPHAFRMLRLHRRRLYCFEVDISSGAPARKVRMQYTWVLRTTVLVVGCYVWQTCVLTFWAIDMQTDPFGRQKLVAACGTRRADCFGMPHNYDFFSVNANPDNLCTKFPNLAKFFRLPLPGAKDGAAADGAGDLLPDRRRTPLRAQQREQQREWSAVGVAVEPQGAEEPAEEETGWTDAKFLKKYRYVTCAAFARPDTIAVTQHLCIAFALANMIVTLFQVLVWLLYRARSSWLPLLVLLVGVVFLAVWVGSIFIPRLLTFFSSWISYVMLLSTPVILWTALLAAHNLRKIQHQKLELWKKQANRPMAESDDPAVGAAVANAAAPLIYSASVSATGQSLRYRDKLGAERDLVPANILTGVNPFSKFSLGRPALSPFLGRFQPQQQRREVGAAAAGAGGEPQSFFPEGTQNALQTGTSDSFSPTTAAGMHAFSAGTVGASAVAPAAAVQQQQQQPPPVPPRTQSAAPVWPGERPGPAAAAAAGAAADAREARAAAAGLAPAWRQGDKAAEEKVAGGAAAVGEESATAAARGRAAAAAGVRGEGGTASTAEGGTAGRVSPLSNEGAVSDAHRK